MLIRLNRKLMSVFCLMTMFTISAPAQDENAFIKLEKYGGRKVPKSLLTVVSIDLNDVPFEQALSTIATEGNFKLNYNRSRIPIHQSVSLSVDNASALEALLQILESTKTELLITNEGQLVIVPSKQTERQKGSIKGRVLDMKTKEPLFGTNVFLVGTQIGSSTGPDGDFSIDQIPAGKYTLQFSYLGYEIKRFENVSVSAQNTVKLEVELEPQAILLKEVTVTPGQFSIMGKGPTVRQSLTREDLETVPFGEDIYRATSRLPGISASDFSAKFTVRGGEHDQILVLLDGLELYEPFHLKEIEGGALSIIDVTAIEGIELLTGGFSAEYGDRMSGVFNMKTTRAPAGKRRTSLGLSFMNARVMSEGTFSNDRGAWLFSARRGYLDLVMDLMGEENPPRPVYYDLLSKVEYKLSEKNTLSAHILHAGDRFDFIEDDEDEDYARYRNTNAWLILKSIPTSRLFVQSLASYGRLKHDRSGVGYTDDLQDIDFEVSDENTVDMFGFKQDWSLDISDRWYLKWGFDFKNFTAKYDYLSTQRNERWLSADSFIVWTDTTQVNLDPSGKKFGAYLSNRFRALSPVTVELGLRYDHNSFTSSDLISPRVNLVYALGKQTFLRGGWGYFYQSQGIHDIQVSDGEKQFYPAELAKHWVAGFEHTFRNGFNFRLEGYYKDLSDIRPDYRNWSNEIEVFPELMHDRFKLNFRGATSKGIEAYLKYDRGRKFTWWASYALAYTDDEIQSLVYQGIEYPGGNKKFPGRYDQRHTFYLDMNYRPNKKWHVNLSWQFHSGWPYTEMIIKSYQLPDGATVYYSAYDEFHKARYPAYHRLDLRVNRHFYTSKGRISAFLALINVYNRENVRNIEYNWMWDRRTGQPFLQETNENWFKLLPSIGVSWSWNH